MNIGGLQHCSLIDYPGKISAIVFTRGCNFRCPYCHNPELVDETTTCIPQENILAFLSRRTRSLDAVTITGGEPTIQDGLISFIKEIKNMGFLVKLDTNGTNPEIVEELQKEKRVDYIAMDIKAPLSKYNSVVARPVNANAIRKTIRLLISGKIKYEFRTTVIKSLLTFDDLYEIGKDIRGAQKYVLQKFISKKTLNPSFLRKTTYSDEEFLQMKEIMSDFVANCSIR